MSKSKGVKRPGLGFAAMDPLRRREIASMGGKASHEFGLAHEFNSETGRAAVKKMWAEGKGRSVGRPKKVNLGEPS